MQVPRSIAAILFAAVLSVTDTAGASHVLPTNGRQPRQRQSRLHSGWIGLGINTAVLIAKMAMPSLGRHPLSWT